MSDDSHLDARYFVSDDTYNCPFCNRRHVMYNNLGFQQFDWAPAKTCYAWFVKCRSCTRVSMHLTFDQVWASSGATTYWDQFSPNVELDAAFFFHAPSSFFTLDERVPRVIRELVTEADACRKMNLLTGASACCRKAIYEFTVEEGATEGHYEDRIKSLKGKFPAVDNRLFDVLAHIQDMTSDKVHEQSWDKWDSATLEMLLAALKEVLHEVYVVPDERESGVSRVEQLLSRMKGATKAALGGSGAEDAPAPSDE